MPSPIPVDLGAIFGNDIDPQAQSTVTKRAQKHLRNKNKHQHKCHLTLPGSVKLAAGQVVTLEGYGVFDGRWLIETLRHRIGQHGFTTEMDLRLCLTY